LKLDTMEMTLDELEENKKRILELSKNSLDDRVKFNATKLLAETELKIADLRWKMYEHDNPATHRSEIVGRFELVPPSELTVKVVSAESNKNASH
jgi:hypothetical protein